MFRFLIKLIISLLLLGWVFSKTDLSSIGQAFSQCHWSYLFIAFLLHGVGLWISVVRWKVLLAAVGGKASFVYLLKSYLVGSFFNTFLPTTMGGDISRTFDTKQEAGGSKTRSFAIVFVERFTGVVAMILMALVVLPFSLAVIPKGSYIAETIIGFLVLFLLFVGVLFLPQTARLVGKQSKIAKFHDSLVVYAHHLPQLSWAFVLGLLLQINVVLHYYFLCLALGLNLSILFLFLIIPIYKVVLMLPFSINGIGLRENTFAYFFQAKGISVASALALSWLDLGMLLMIALIGGIIYMTRSRR